ncbi:hypothetical protein ACIP88_18300 [Streptomyces uncialis]|uniref:hypothetical protein n=1 Tax=Streptomyces uncialis TaxID=1048205 RepID=UPI003827F0DD
MPASARYGGTARSAHSGRTSSTHFSTAPAAAPAAVLARIPAVLDLALAAAHVAAVVFVMNKDGTFPRHHLLAEARRHLALVLRGRPREPRLDDQVVDTAIATHCLDITDSRTLRSRTPVHRICTTRWTEADLRPARRQPAIPDKDRQLPPDTDGAPATPRLPDQLPPGTGAPATPRLPDQALGEWEIPRVPLRYDRAVLAAGVVRAKLCTAGRGYDVVAYQQATMPEQLLPPSLSAEPARDDDDQEQEQEQEQTMAREAVDLTAVRALKKSRTDVECLGLTAEQLRHIQKAGERAGEQARERAAQYAEQGAAGEPSRPVRADEQQAHRPQQPGPHRGPGAGYRVDSGERSPPAGRCRWSSPGGWFPPAGEGHRAGVSGIAG